MLLTNHEEPKLKVNVIRSGLDLKAKQGLWETPRNIGILLGVVAAIARGLGFKIGQNSPPAQIILQAGSIVVSPQVLAPAKQQSIA